MPSAKVIVQDRFRDLGYQYERGIKRALGETASIEVAIARENSKGQYQIDDILATAKATPVHRELSSSRFGGGKGWRVIVYYEDFRGVFFEFGTGKRRRRKLHPRTLARRANPSGVKRQQRFGNNPGVYPQGNMTRGLRAARQALLSNIQREIG